ncbi:MAG: zinc ribbon domain-containing protein [Oscillospiraceae bacterium]
MDKKTVVSIIKLLFGIQIIAAVMLIVADIVALCNYDINEISKLNTLFDAVMTVRVGAIIIFSVSLLICGVMYLLHALYGKSFGGALVATFLFIMNFVLKPYSSYENLEQYLRQRAADMFENAFSGSSSQSSDSGPFFIFILLIIASVIIISLYGSSFTDVDEFVKTADQTTDKTPDEKKDNWICPQCKCKNPTSSRNCLICGTIAPQKIGESNKNNKTWVCTECQTINSVDKKYCVKCKKLRAEKICPNCDGVIDANAPYCPICKTTFQLKRSSKCSICGSEIAEGLTMCEKCRNQPPVPVISEEKGRTCFFCGKTISPGAKFCGKCGKIQPPTVEEEKKAVICECGAEIPLGNSFCGKCGKPVPKERICKKCGKIVPPEFAFCGVCGTEFGKE